jgi:uncharacterized protein
LNFSLCEKRRKYKTLASGLLAYSHNQTSAPQNPIGYNKSSTSLPTMPLAKLILEIEIPHAQSLKDRRQVVRSMKEKLRHGFNLSIAELDDAVVWNRATLGIAAISSSTSYLTGQLQQIDQAAHRIAASLSAEIADSYAEILPE